MDEAIRRGYDVTTFSRGLSGEPRPGAEALHGDRTNSADLLRLAERDFDLVIDTSVIAPRHVAASARLLAPRVRHYTYISSLSVYRGFGEVAVSEESPVLDCPPDSGGDVEELGYGELKAGSERAVARELPGRHLIARPGLIVGPHENVGRLPWWLSRIARGGTVLAPGEPGRPLRMTDARDLAAWLVDNTRRGIPGVVNVPGAGGDHVRGAADRLRPGHRARPGRAAAAALGARPGAPGRRGRALDGAADVDAGHAGVRGHLGCHRGPGAADRHPLPAAQRYRPRHLVLAAPGRRGAGRGSGSGPGALEGRPGLGLDLAKEQAILASLD